MSDFVIKSGSTGPPLTVQLKDGDIPVNLTGASVVMRMRRVSGGALVITDAPVVIIDPLDGIVEFDGWTVLNTAEAGDYEVEWVVTFSDLSEQVYPADGYTMVEITPDLDSPAPETLLPDLPNYCWPVDDGCCAAMDTYSPQVQARAKALAGQTLRMLTGGRVGGCPVTVRPCRTVACPTPNWYWSGGSFRPYIYNGTWINSCGCPSNCSHTAIEQIELPLPIGRVDAVKVDGVVLDPTDYRVDDGRWLVRTDGGVWPTSQDLTLADTEVGTFSVTYLNAFPVDALGAYAAGVLACEFAKACSGGKCALPSGVTQIVRAGITMTIQEGAFPNGFTGIREVDAYIAAWNPNRLRTAPRVWTPGMATPRVTGV